MNGKKHLLRVKMHELAAWGRVGSLRRQQRAAVVESVVVSRTWIYTQRLVLALSRPVKPLALHLLVATV